MLKKTNMTMTEINEKHKLADTLTAVTTKNEVIGSITEVIKPKKPKGEFWCPNRVKILASGVITVLALYIAAYLAAPSAEGKIFLLSLGYMYIASPILIAILQKLKVVKVKNMPGFRNGVYLKVINKLYIRSDGEIALNNLKKSILFGGFSAAAFGMVLCILYSKYRVLLSPLAIIFAFPFLAWHLICFIGDHPLSFFKTIRYAKLSFTPNSEYVHNIYQDQHTRILPSAIDFNSDNSSDNIMTDLRYQYLSCNIHNTDR
jgi:hypothetical protein